MTRVQGTLLMTARTWDSLITGLICTPHQGTDLCEAFGECNHGWCFWLAATSQYPDTFIA
jgi:hypothetical protein